jgi:hypothetical protein
MEGHFRLYTKPQIGQVGKKIDQLHRFFPQDAAGSSIPCLPGRRRGSTCSAQRRLPRLLPAKGRRLPGPPHAACPRILPASQDAAAGRPLPAPPHAVAGWAFTGPHHAAAGHPSTARCASRLRVGRVIPFAFWLVSRVSACASSRRKILQVRLPIGRVVPFALWLISSLEGLRLRVVPPEDLTGSSPFD